MADISKITLPNGSSYNFKDATARSGLEGKAATSHKQAFTSSECTSFTSDDNTMGTTPAAVKKAIGMFEPKSHTHTKSQITDFPTIPTKTSQLTNDSGFKTTDNNTTYSLSKSGSTITLTGSDGSKTSVTDTDTNTWRGIQNNLTSDSTTDSLSAAQGKVLKGLVDGKAASSHTHTKSQITDFPTSLPANGGNATTVNSHTVNSDVPANAKFTDTVYTLPAATSSTLGGVKIGSNITNSSGTISLTKANITSALGYTPLTTAPYNVITGTYTGTGATNSNNFHEINIGVQPEAVFINIILWPSSTTYRFPNGFVIKK